MVEVRQTERFAQWLDGLRDLRGRAKVQARLERLIGGPVTLAKTADMYRPQSCQGFQQVMGADAVTPVRWKRHAVREKKNAPHHAKPRAIHGPTVLAIGSGSFFHILIFRL